MEEVIECPYCGEEILAAAKKCKHCGKWLEENADTPVKNKSGMSIIVGAIIVAAAVILGSVISGNSGSDNGDKVLVVKIDYSDNGEDVSEEKLIKEALEKGGRIILGVDLIREIDYGFDEKYTATNSKGNFNIRAAVLNFVGGQGWHFVQVFGMPGDPEYYFTKTR
jgi:hypothetical protein